MHCCLESVRPVADLELAKVVFGNFQRIAELGRPRKRSLREEQAARRAALQFQWPMLLEASGCDPGRTWTLDFEFDPPILRAS